MAISDPLGDTITRIRNAQMRGKHRVSSPSSKLRIRVLDVLAREGYIVGYSNTSSKGGPELEIELKYLDGRAVIRTIERVSKPGCRIYSSARNIPSVSNGLGISILSTSHGIISDHQARGENVGGEILCRVF